MEIWVDIDINNNNIDNDSYDLLNTYNVKDFPQNSFFHPHGEAPRVDPPLFYSTNEEIKPQGS